MTPRDLLAREFLGNPASAWMIAGGLLVVTFALFVFLRGVLIRRLERTAAASETMVDDVALDGLQRTSRVFLLVLAVTAATYAVDLPDARRLLIEKLAKLVFLFQAASWGNGAISFWLLRMTRHRGAHDKASLTTLNVIGIVMRIVLWTLLFLLALQAFGVDVTALVTGLGIVGIAVALAVQNILGDLLASLSIALDKPFVLGDYIVVEGGFQGTVEDIGLKTTRLRSLSGEQIVMANAELLKARIRNFQRQRERRVAFTLQFPLETPPAAIARVPAIIRELLGAEEQVRIDRSHFHAITDQALAVETVYFVLSADYKLYMDIQQRVNLALLEQLAAERIPLAVPTRSVTVRGGETDGRDERALAVRGAAAAG